MNNLHRELAPISDAAWAQIEEETSRTLKRYLAGRRVVDVHGPAGTALSAVGTGHLRKVGASDEGVLFRQRETKALVELRVPFELERQMIDDVERGANDSDWQPAKDAARKLAFTEDRAIFEGYGAAEPVAPSRRQRPVFGSPQCRCLHRARRNQRLRLPRSRTRQAFGRRQNHLGARH